MLIPVLTHSKHVPLENLGLEGVVCTDDPGTFESQLRNPTVAVVECLDPTKDPSFYVWLRGLCVTTPGCAIVCVAPLDAAFVSALAPVPCADVVQRERLAEDLPRVLRKWRSPGPEPVLRRIAVGASLLSPLPRQALHILCDPERPMLRTVAELCGVMHVSETLLRQAWRVDFPGCSPKRVLDWIMMGWALAEGGEVASLAGLSVKFGVHESTLERMSLRLTGRTVAVNLRREGLARTSRELGQCAGSVFRRALERSERA